MSKSNANFINIEDEELKIEISFLIAKSFANEVSFIIIFVIDSYLNKIFLF